MLPDPEAEKYPKLLIDQSGATNEFSNELWLVQPDYKKMAKVLY